MASIARSPKDLFSSRFGLILAALGMAIGAGNIWRFPRIMAKFEGGGTFLIPWAIFLFTWSIPLLIAETAIGRKTRKGVVASLGQMLGPSKTWIGAFVALCTILIMCYYATVAGWCGLYVWESVRGEAAKLPHDGATEHFKVVAQGLRAAIGMAAAFLIACFFVSRGIKKGVELANRIFLPLLFALLIVLIIAGLSREGASAGVAYMFKVDWEALKTPSPWLEGLTQSAWSTGAGWGLWLVLSVAARGHNTSVGDSVITGVGNNVASLVAAFATIPAVFALAPMAAPGQDVMTVLRENGPGGTGLAMVWLPKIFAQVGAMGPVLSSIFFVALTFAAFTSLIAMVELATRTLIDLGIPRKKAIERVFLAACIFGLPSAFSLEVFANQDWVWGVGLMLSGFIIAMAVGRVGYRRFREEWILGDTIGARLGRWFDFVLMLLIPLQFVVLIGWWFWQAFGWAGKDWKKAFHPFDTFTIGTCLFQWTLAFVILFLLNRRLRKSAEKSEDQD